MMQVGDSFDVQLKKGKREEASMINLNGNNANENARAATDRIVQLSNVSHWYESSGGQVHALSNIDLTIHPREFVCVVGSSGCGKTTLMNMLAGFLSPREGTITIGGDAVDGPDPSRGVVFQQPNLFPWLNVRENVSFGPKMSGESPRSYEPRVQELLELVSLGDVGDRAPYQLSGGMQQRVAIARALAKSPDILLMDEPFGALDALTRERLQEELLALWRHTKKTILFITHSVEEAVYLGTRVVVMSPRPGRVAVDKDVRMPELHSILDPQAVRASSEFSSMREEIAAAIYRGSAV